MTNKERNQRRAEILINLTHEAAKRKREGVGLTKDLLDKYFLYEEIKRLGDALRKIWNMPEHHCECELNLVGADEGQCTCCIQIADEALGTGE